MFHYAQLTAATSAEAQEDLLDEMNEVMTEKSSDTFRPWFVHLNKNPNQEEVEFEYLGWPKELQSDFLALAVFFGLSVYVEAKVGDDNALINRGNRRPLTFYASENTDKLEDGRLPNTSIVDLLLKNDGDVNTEFEGKIAWQLAAAHAILIAGRDLTFTKSSVNCFSCYWTGGQIPMCKCLD